MRFFDLGLAFGCHATQMEKKQLHMRVQNFKLDILKKKFSKISKHKKARPTLKIFGRAISSLIINFRFLPFSGHFRTCGEKLFASSRRRKISCRWRKRNRADISRGADLRADKKKSLCLYIFPYYFLISLYANGVVLVSLLLTLNMFHTLF